MRLHGVVLMGVLGAGGCLQTSVVECADGRVCPEGTVCDVVGASCVVPGGLVVSGGLLQVDDVSCGSTEEVPISLGNFGDEPLSFTASSTIDIVSIEPSSGTIAPGSRVDVILTADATATSLPVGMVEGAIYFTTDTEVVPKIVQVTIAGAVVRASEQALDFGIAALSGLPDPRPVTLFNDGNAAIDVSLSAPDDPFGLGVTRDLRIDAGSSESVDVSFAPTFTGTYSSVVELGYSGAVCQPPPTTIDLSGQISDAPILVGSTIVDFGTTACGVPQDSRELTFSSNTAAQQTLSFVSTGAGAGSYGDLSPVTLDPGGDRVVMVNRLPVTSPSSTGLQSATVSVSAAPAGDSFNVSLRSDIVAPVLAAAPKQLNLGIVQTNDTTTSTVMVTNSGNAPALVKVMPPSYALPDGGTVRIEPSSFTLEESEMTAIDVVVQTRSGGFATSGLTFNLDSPGQCSQRPVITVGFAVAGQVPN